VKKVLLFVFSVLVVSCGKKQETTQPIVKDITQAVYASGRLYPKNFYRVASKVPGIVAEIYVVAGDTVQRGMPLVKIRNTVAQIGVETAENVYELASDNAKSTSSLLGAAEADLKSAQSKYEYDSLTATRQRRLLDARATSQSVYDAAAIQVEISRQLLRKAQQSYRNMQQRAQIDQRNARLQVAAQKSTRDDYIIYAEEDGIVYDVLPAVGEMVSPQMALIELGRVSDYDVELNVDETDIAYLRIGQNVVYTIDSYKQGKFYGVITHINPRVSASDKTSKVTASISQAEFVRFLPGMSLEANIVVAERSKAVVIPRNYLKNGSFVQIERDNGPIMQKVTVGIEDLRYVEILKGITTSDVLIK
jgi:multidrug resistance efflux pump